MTQVSRYGHMLKIRVNGMRMKVTARYRVDGSVLNDTIQGRMLGAETTLEIASPDPPALVARVAQRRARLLRDAGAAAAGPGHRSNLTERESSGRMTVSCTPLA